MKATVQAAKPSEVDVTISITMSVARWTLLRDQLIRDQQKAASSGEEPAWGFERLITAAVEGIHQVVAVDPTPWGRT